MLQPRTLEAVLAAPAADEEDATTARILQAAFDEFLSFGLRRATVEDVTRRAKVGRMTLHRRFPTKQALIEAVFLREIRRTLVEVADVIDDHEDTTERLVHGLGYGLRQTATHPLFSRLLETDAEAMLPYLTTEAHALMTAASGFVALQIAGGRRPTAAHARAGEAIIRICHSVLLTPRGNVDLEKVPALERFLRAAIAPIIDDLRIA